jgi:hypothetical protein
VNEETFNTSRRKHEKRKTSLCLEVPSLENARGSHTKPLKMLERSLEKVRKVKRKVEENSREHWRKPKGKLKAN